MSFCHSDLGVCYVNVHNACMMGPLENSSEFKSNNVAEEDSVTGYISDRFLKL